MALSIGIVGLPNVGKSTLFNAMLKKQQALAANYPFATIEPNVGIVPVPDNRLEILAKAVRQSERLTTTPPLVPATVTFIDIAGIVKGASEGEGLGNKFLAHIRECDAICMVIRAFSDPEVVMTGQGKFEEDKEVILTELALADLQTLEKQQLPKGKVTPEQQKRSNVIEKMKQEQAINDEEKEQVRDLCLLTMKPIIYVKNVGETEFAQAIKIKSEEIVINAKMESELAELQPAEQREYLAEYGLTESGLERLIKVGYEKLRLQSFLTAGEIECRAWTIRQGTTAVEASGVIHTDFMKKFIKADVIDWKEFVKLGGWKKAREAGAVRSEGRDYIMKDGEVVEFRIGG